MEATSLDEESQPIRSRRQLRRRRVFIFDQRDQGRHLRMTWHREKSVFVVSTWAHDVCTGSVRIPVEQAPEVISLLADGLGDAAAARTVVASGETERSSSGLADRLATWLGFGKAGKRRPRRKAGPATNATILKLR